MLQVKIGQAMVITHDYEGAISYYRKSMSGADNANLRLDLAELLQKLGALDDAIEILKEGTGKGNKYLFHFFLWNNFQNLLTKKICHGSK